MGATTSRDRPHEDETRLSLHREHDGTEVVALRGRWRFSDGIPEADPLLREAAEERPQRIAFDASALEIWDSGLVSFVERLSARAADEGIAVDRSGLPSGVQRLLALAEAVPAARASVPSPRRSRLARLGQLVLERAGRYRSVLTFAGEVTLGFGRIFRPGSPFRLRDLFLQMQVAGAQALGVVTLVSFLVGMILAFVGSIQLAAFGATVYVANLVGIAMVRDVAAIMTAVVVAGRTGAAFAAELGTMRVSQEIDALATLGVSRIEYLVLPRLLALTAMMPLLCMYADAVGVLGGGVVTVGLMDVTRVAYWHQTLGAVTPGHLVGGLIKATVYGGLVAAAGCFEGLRCGSSAAAIGRASTAAVVDGIVLVIAAAGVFAVVFYALRI